MSFALYLSPMALWQLLRSISRASDGTRIVVECSEFEQLYPVLAEGSSRDDIVVDFVKESGHPLPCLRASSKNSNYEAYLAAIPGAILESTYEKYGARLLELNVRAFLGVRGRKSVNAGLRNTIIEEPSNFLAFNNGIVAVVDEIDLSTDGTASPENSILTWSSDCQWWANHCKPSSSKTTRQGKA